MTLTQNGPLAPSFLTVCIDKSAAQKYGLPDDAMSLVIHAYGDATEDTCENFGPHFNPYGVIVSNTSLHALKVKSHIYKNKISCYQNFKKGCKISFLHNMKVPHGHPEDVSKHVGDLGILEFRQVPAEWPEDVIRCKANQIGIMLNTVLAFIRDKVFRYRNIKNQTLF